MLAPCEPVPSKNTIACNQSVTRLCGISASKVPIIHRNRSDRILGLSLNYSGSRASFGCGTRRKYQDMAVIGKALIVEPRVGPYAS
jgi:hypothetical protein